MRMSVVAKERKISQSAPSKIDSIVRQLFVPMLSMPTPSHTSFLMEDCEEALLRQVAQDKPDSTGSEDARMMRLLSAWCSSTASFSLGRTLLVLE